MVCRAQDKRRLDGKSPESVYGCDTCQVNLCQVGNCFMKFHNRVETVNHMTFFINYCDFFKV